MFKQLLFTRKKFEKYEKRTNCKRTGSLAKQHA